MNPTTIATNSATVMANSDARVQVGNNYSTTIHHHTDSDRDSCLANLCLADPREEKARIEQTKGGLFQDAYKWILNNDEFHQWRHDKRSWVLWIKGDAGKGKTMLLCSIINELPQSSLLASQTKENEGVTGVVDKLLSQLKRLSPSARRPVLLSHFFCQATNSRLNSAVAVLHSLIYLLLL